MEIKQSTARNVMILMVDSSDHISGKAGLTLSLTASKDGGAFSAIAPTVTDRGNGWYNLALTSGNTDTLGDLALHIVGTGADPTDIKFDVVANITPASQSDVTEARDSIKGAGGKDLTQVESETAAIKVQTDKVQFDGSSYIKSVQQGAVPKSPATLAAADVSGNIPANVQQWNDGALPTVGDATVAGQATINNNVLAIKDKTDNLPVDPASNTQVNTRLAASGYTAPDNADIAAIKAKTDNLPASPAAIGDIPSAVEIAGQVWDDAIADHTGVGSTGEKLSLASAPSAADVADAVLDEALADHATSGSVGGKLNGLFSAGIGNTQVDHNTGGADNMKYVDENGIGIDGAWIRAFLKSDYDAGNRTDAFMKDYSQTTVTGAWQWPMHLDSGNTYTIEFYKQGIYSTSTKEITI